MTGITPHWGFPLRVEAVVDADDNAETGRIDTARSVSVSAGTIGVGTFRPPHNMILSIGLPSCSILSAVHPLP